MCALFIECDTSARKRDESPTLPPFMFIILGVPYSVHVSVDRIRL